MKNLIIIFIFFITISSSCNKESETCHKKITFINKSTISVFTKWAPNYPDTTIVGNWFPNPLNEPFLNEVLSSGTNTQALTAGNDCLESRFKSQITSGIMMIYVFDKAVLQNNNWDTIKKYNMYLKRYDLSLQDLQNNEWTITYP